MPEVEWAYLCDRAYLSGSNPCLYGIFDSLEFTSLPITRPIIFVGIQIRMSLYENGEFTVLINSPTNIQINQSNASVSGIGGKSFLIFVFLNTTFTETGQHIVNLLIDGVSVYTIPLTVRIT